MSVVQKQEAYGQRRICTPWLVLNWPWEEREKEKEKIILGPLAGVQNVIICLVKKHDDDKQTHSPSIHNKYIANIAELFIRYR